MENSVNYKLVHERSAAIHLSRSSSCSALSDVTRPMAQHVSQAVHRPDSASPLHTTQSSSTTLLSSVSHLQNSQITTFAQNVVNLLEQRNTQPKDPKDIYRCIEELLPKENRLGALKEALIEVLMTKMTQEGDEHTKAVFISILLDQGAQLTQTDKKRIERESGEIPPPMLTVIFKSMIRNIFKNNLSNEEAENQIKRAQQFLPSGIHGMMAIKNTVWILPRSYLEHQATNMLIAKLMEMFNTKLSEARTPEEERDFQASEFSKGHHFLIESMSVSYSGEKGLSYYFLDILLSQADVNMRDAHGNTALMVAVNKFSSLSSKEDMQVVSALLARGADVNAQNNAGDTALMLAIKGLPESMQVVSALLAREDIDVNKRCNNGETALMWAVGGGQVGGEQVGGEQNEFRQVARALLARGDIDVNMQDDDGQTALMHAIGGDVHIVNALLAKGADVNIRDKNGNTAFKLAEEDLPREEHMQALWAILERMPNADF